MNDIHGPEIDFSPLFDKDKNFAVYCKTKDDAENFLMRLREAYPSRMRTWEYGETHYGRYAQTCYRPNLNMPENHTLKYGPMEHYVSADFKIIPYEDLIIQEDIWESDRSFDLLLT